MTEFLKDLWTKMFGTTEWAGINMGFWVSMFAVALLVAVMIVVFWTMKPKKKLDGDEPDDLTTAKNDTKNSDGSHTA